MNLKRIKQDLTVLRILPQVYPEMNDGIQAEGDITFVDVYFKKNMHPESQIEQVNKIVADKIDDVLIEEGYEEEVTDDFLFFVYQYLLRQ